mgnify:FL=1
MVSPFPAYRSASFPAFACCCCTVLSANEASELEAMYMLDYTFEEWESARMLMGTRPLYAEVYVCRCCEHTCCKEHFTEGLCYACTMEPY